MKWQMFVTSFYLSLKYFLIWIIICVSVCVRDPARLVFGIYSGKILAQLIVSGQRPPS